MKVKVIVFNNYKLMNILSWRPVYTLKNMLLDSTNRFLENYFLTKMDLYHI